MLIKFHWKLTYRSLEIKIFPTSLFFTFFQNMLNLILWIANFIRTIVFLKETYVIRWRRIKWTTFQEPICFVRLFKNRGLCKNYFSKWLETTSFSNFVNFISPPNLIQPKRYFIFRPLEELPTNWQNFRQIGRGVLPPPSL